MGECIRTRTHTRTLESLRITQATVRANENTPEKPSSAFAVAFRYPGESTTRDMARLAVANAKQIREQIRMDMRIG